MEAFSSASDDWFWGVAKKLRAAKGGGQRGGGGGGSGFGRFIFKGFWRVSTVLITSLAATRMLLSYVIVYLEGFLLSIITVSNVYTPN